MDAPVLVVGGKRGGGEGSSWPVSDAGRRALSPAFDPADLPNQRLEPEQHAGVGCLGADSRYGRHLWDEVTLAVRGHVLLLLLLAHRGPLELLH